LRFYNIIVSLLLFFEKKRKNLRLCACCYQLYVCIFCAVCSREKRRRCRTPGTSLKSWERHSTGAPAAAQSVVMTLNGNGERTVVCGFLHLFFFSLSLSLFKNTRKEKNIFTATLFFCFFFRVFILILFLSRAFFFVLNSQKNFPNIHLWCALPIYIPTVL
jgi:hypothetical protein